MGIASGMIHPFPDRDDTFINKFDAKHQEEKKRLDDPKLI
jgi:hypothetical protein